MTKYASNKNLTITDIMKMYWVFFYETVKQNPAFDLSEERNMNALLSISTALYHQSVRILSLNLQRYCNIYGADLVDCLKVLYEVYYKANLPDLIKDILSDIEKNVLVKELWDTDKGYKLLVEGKNEENVLVFNRLNRRIHERICEICKANNVEANEVKKIEALVSEIMAKKTVLLETNKLDQIIICSICACLNLNEAKYKLALSKIFLQYNSVSLSYHSNCETLSQEEGPLTLLQFYNMKFVN